jgi:type I restriction enzyme S subunit
MVMECKDTARKSHYPKDVPFEVPEGWVWTEIAEISSSINYGVSESAKVTGKYRLLRITDIQDGKVSWESVPFTDYPEDKAKAFELSDGDILFARTGATVGKSYLVESAPNNAIFASYLIRVQYSHSVIPQYIKFFFESGYYWEQISSNSVGVGQPNVNGTSLGKLRIPLPPAAEQKRISEEAHRWMGVIDSLEFEAQHLSEDIGASKSRILNLAIHGKLVPQDPSDEPAIGLLKRINPNFKASDNLHYEGKLPSGWMLCCLEDVLDYEQPQAYIVESTDYSDDYKTPVLTPGKSFVLGYTNETSGICNSLPVIIFDDFTTESKYVDFPFKVKSSAMKILHARGEINLEYVAIFMSITRLVGDTHKRYWISEYSKIPIPIPPQNEQRRIVETVGKHFQTLDSIRKLLQY